MPEKAPPPASLPLPAASRDVTVARWREGTLEQVRDRVAEEVPVALSFHGVPHVVMLATPSDLEDLAVGFTLSEGIVAHRDEIRSVEAGQREDGALEVRIGIAADRFSELLRRQRNLTGRTGCGLCGAQTVEEAIRNPPPVTGSLKIHGQALHEALLDLSGRQAINARTGSVHAAAWVLPESGIQFVREDVGRHNALDKVIGGALLADRLPLHDCGVVVSGRASFELLQKAMMAGIPMLAAVGAPSSLAVDLAEEFGITLVGFLRDDRYNVYSHPERIV